MARCSWGVKQSDVVVVLFICSTSILDIGFRLSDLCWMPGELFSHIFFGLLISDLVTETAPLVTGTICFCFQITIATNLV